MVLYARSIWTKFALMGLVVKAANRTTPKYVDDLLGMALLVREAVRKGMIAPISILDCVIIQ